MICAFAPGKVVVLGEYAVVDGAPAIVAAVPNGVRCEVYAAPTLAIDTPGGDDRFVRAALTAVDAPPGRYVFSDAIDLGLAEKPGVGGSAAATVAAVRAADAAAGRTRSEADTFAVAARVHHEVQGSGSGIDVAASVWGGFLRFQRGAPPSPTRAAPFAVVWSGASAKTGPRVQQYLAGPDREAFVAASAANVEDWQRDPVGATRRGHALLAAMTTRAGIAWSTPALGAIEALAAQVGGAAKPSGAGGGDVAIAVFATPEDRDRFVVLVAEAGFRVVAVG